MYSHYSDIQLPVGGRVRGENLWIWLMAVCKIFLCVSFSSSKLDEYLHFYPLTKWLVCLISLLGEVTMRINCKCILSTLQPKTFLRSTTIILIYMVFTQLSTLHPCHSILSFIFRDLGQSSKLVTCSLAVFPLVLYWQALMKWTSGEKKHYPISSAQHINIHNSGSFMLESISRVF